MTRSDLSRLSVRRAASFAKHKVKTSARKAVSLIRTWQSGERLLFIYGGRTSHWVGMGRRLYEQDPVFRASVQATDESIRHLLGWSVLSNFDGSANLDFFADGTRVTTTILTLQLALTDLWLAKGIRPNATAGVSLGEVAAVYAAGGLTRQDAVRISASWFLVSQQESKEYVSLVLQTSLAHAQVLCSACPTPLMGVYEGGPATALVMCRKADKPQVSAFLDQEGISHQQPYSDTTKPYHTPLFERHRPFIRQYLRAITPQPLRLDYYSATLGKQLPKHTFVPVSLWDDLLCSPVLLHRTLRAMLTDNVTTLLQVGPHPFLTGSVQRAAFDLINRVRVLSSMQQQDAQEQTFRRTYRQLRLRAWRRRPTLRWQKPVPDDPRTEFTAQLDLWAPGVLENTQAVYGYLRRQGDLHYLPAHKAWLVVNYQLVNQVIQQPTLFSNRVHQDFDSLLLGADPPDHILIRSLMRPLFTSQALSTLERYVAEVVHQRLDALSTRPSFDVVDELSLPLVQSVIGRFLGLQLQESAALQASLTGHLYAMNYFDDLTRFFHRYLEQLPDQPDERMGSLLMTYVRSGQLTFAGAVNLMKLFWIAGTTTTSMLISSGVNLLLRQPAVAEQLRNDPLLVPKFVDECLRLEPPESALWRLTTQATSLAGQALPAGTLVMLSVTGANRDPQVFADADTVILSRPTKRNFGFGGGIHHCIGAAIARLEAQITIGAILTRLPHLRAAEAGSPTYFSSSHLRGLARLPVYT